MDYKTCLEEAFSVNLGIHVDGEAEPDPTPLCMLGHCEDKDPLSDLQALSKCPPEYARQLIKRHLGELARFSEEDLVAALEDDESMAGGSQDG